MTNIHEINQRSRAVLWSNAEGYALALGMTAPGFDSTKGKARVEVHAYVPASPINTSKHHPATHRPRRSGEPMVLAATFDVLVPGARLSGPEFINHEPVVFSLRDAFEAACDVADDIFEAHASFRARCSGTKADDSDNEAEDAATVSGDGEPRNH